MKYLLIILMLSGFIYCDETKRKTVSFDENSTLSAKEISFQNYLNKLEKENKKLEDDGFCSCNNH